MPRTISPTSCGTRTWMSMSGTGPLGRHIVVCFCGGVFKKTGEGIFRPEVNNTLCAITRHPGAAAHHFILMHSAESKYDLNNNKLDHLEACLLPSTWEAWGQVWEQSYLLFYVNAVSDWLKGPGEWEPHVQFCTDGTNCSFIQWTSVPWETAVRVGHYNNSLRGLSALRYLAVRRPTHLGPPYVLQSECWGCMGNHLHALLWAI